MDQAPLAGTVVTMEHAHLQVSAVDTCLGAWMARDSMHIASRGKSFMGSTLSVSITLTAIVPTIGSPTFDLYHQERTNEI